MSGWLYRSMLITALTASVLVGCSRSGPNPAIPDYPGATKTISTPEPQKEQVCCLAEIYTFETSDEKDAIAAFYQGALPQEGWKKSFYNWETGGPDDGLHYDDLTYCPYYMLAINIEENPSKNKVVVKLFKPECV